MRSATRFSLDEVKAADKELMSRYIDLLRGLTRFDLSRPYFAWRIRRHVVRIRSGYVGEIQLGRSEQATEWLQTRIDELAEFEASFIPAPISLRTLLSTSKSAAKTTMSLGTLLLVVPAAGAGISATIITLVNSCYCEVIFWTWFATLGGLCIFAFLLADTAKEFRTEQGGAPTDALERGLFDQLPTVRRPSEPPALACWGLAFLAGAAVTALGHAIAVRGHSHHRSVPLALLSTDVLYVALLFALVGFALLGLSVSRRQVATVA